VITAVYSFLVSLLCQYQARKHFCSKNCDALNLGRFLKELCRLKLYPPPEAPFTGISLHRLLWTIGKMDLPGCTNDAEGSLALEDHIDGTIRKEMAKLESGIVGLELQLPSPR
jgi:hypothetical protein